MPSRERTQAAACRLRPRSVPHLAVSFLLLSALLAAAQASPSQAAHTLPAIHPAAGPRPITTARQAHDLSNQDAIRGLPVHLRGVITYFDPNPETGHTAIFVHDASGSIYAGEAYKLSKGLFVGALVDVRGVSALGRVAPIVANPRYRVIGRAPLPPNPPRVSLAVLKTCVWDGQWVEVEGSVHSVTEYPHNVTLRLELPDGPLSVTMVRDPGATYSSLVDARVRVHASVAPVTNPTNQVIGVQLQAPNLSAVQVVEPAPSDPFARPYIPVGGLLQWEHFSTPMHRVHLRGAVTLQWPGSLLCIRDATRGICAQTAQATPVAVGGLVDLAGFVEIDNDAPTITDAVFRIAGNSRPVAPQPVTADKILRGGPDSELIQIDGMLIGYDLTSSDATLQLSSGDALFPAILPKSLVGAESAAWKVGSRLRIAGVCSVAIDTQSNIRAGVAVVKSFRVLMRSPADITVVERPSWWTPAHALVVLALALMATLGILAWVAVLRRRVELQAGLLRKSEERFRHMALHDNLTGLATRLLMQDRLHVALESARRRGASLAVLMIDVDHFKAVNDTYGHQAGDEVLRVAANRLQQAVRREDTVARMGGDEFVVLLPDLNDFQAAEVVAAKIVQLMALPVPVGGHLAHVSASVGVCAANGELSDPEDMLRNADVALYHAKESGRNCYRLFAADAALTPASR